jgi:hypothetical protein
MGRLEAASRTSDRPRVSGARAACCGSRCARSAAAAPHVAWHRIRPYAAADPRAALSADPAGRHPSAISGALDRLRFASDEAEGPDREHNRHRERAAGHALAVGAVTGTDDDRCLGDLVPQRAALATAALREFHRAVLLWVCRRDEQWRSKRRRSRGHRTIAGPGDRRTGSNLASSLRHIVPLKRPSPRSSLPSGGVAGRRSGT